MKSSKDKGSLCRNKVNQMLSSLNLKENIFIPKYTLNNRDEEKYSYLNKSKKNSLKNIHKIINNNKNNKCQISKSQSVICTTEGNNKQKPIDFIINHGVIVYQRNFQGEEIVNYGINNNYLRNNNLNMLKKDKNTCQTELNFRNFSNNISKQGSNQKIIKINNSKKSLTSNSEIPLSKNKNASSRQNRAFTTNLNTTQNSINSVNSISVKNFLISSKNKKNMNTIDKNKTNTNFNLKYSKKVNNYVRKRRFNNIQNKFLIIRRKKNNSTLSGNDKKIMTENKTYIKENIISPYNNDKNYNTNYNIKNDYIKESEIKSIKINTPKNQSFNINSGFNQKLLILFKNVNLIIKNYLKQYLQILKEIPTKRVKDGNNSNMENIESEIKIEKIDVNKLREKYKQNKNFINPYCNPEHKKSNNSISINRNISNTTSIKEKENEIKKNKSNTNLSLLITKNLRFFSKEKNNDNKSELFRDSKSLQKKYEQICRRKKRKLTMNTIKNKESFSGAENNYLSDTNKTNTISNFNDNNSIQSLKINNEKKFNLIFYKDSSFNNNNIKDYTNIKRKNYTENNKEKNEYRIKLIKNKNEKKIISYRIEKKNPKTIARNNIFGEQNNSYNIGRSKNNNFLKINNFHHDNININKKRFNSNNKIRNNYKNNIKNKFIKKVFIHKRENYFLEDKNNFKIKVKSFQKGSNLFNNSNNSQNKNISLLIKNICTKDKRISIHITYIKFIPNSKNIFKKNNNIEFQIESVINYNYISNCKRNKKIIRRQNDLEKKLSLINEEDEKSKYLNSTKSLKIAEEEPNSNKKINNLRMSNKIYGNNLNIIKIGNLLEKCFNNQYLNDQKEFIFKLKIIRLVTSIKKIINSKIKDINIIRVLKKRNIEKCKMIYYPKKKKNIQQISNIYIKNKIFSNNIIINENALSPNSLNINTEIKADSSKLKHKIYYKTKCIKKDLSGFELKNKNYMINLND